MFVLAMQAPFHEALVAKTAAHRRQLPALQLCLL